MRTYLHLDVEEVRARGLGSDVEGGGADELGGIVGGEALGKAVASNVDASLDAEEVGLPIGLELQRERLGWVELGDVDVGVLVDLDGRRSCCVGDAAYEVRPLIAPRALHRVAVHAAVIRLEAAL